MDDPDDRNVCRSHRRRTGGHARNIGMSKLVGSRAVVAEVYVICRKRLGDGQGCSTLYSESVKQQGQKI
jgi:hypothetical protein